MQLLYVIIHVTISIGINYFYLSFKVLPDLGIFESFTIVLKSFILKYFIIEWYKNGTRIIFR